MLYLPHEDIQVVGAGVVRGTPVDVLLVHGVHNDVVDVPGDVVGAVGVIDVLRHHRCGLREHVVGEEGECPHRAFVAVGADDDVAVLEVARGEEGGGVVGQESPIHHRGREEQKLL